MTGETTIDMMLGEIATDKIMEETIIGNRDIELEVKVGKILEIITEIIQGND